MDIMLPIGVIMNPFMKGLIMQETTFSDGTIKRELITEEQRLAKAKEAIDNVDAVAFSQRKIGRNQPCPCGSGKKFKKCCLNKPAEDATVSKCTCGEECHEQHTQSGPEGC